MNMPQMITASVGRRGINVSADVVKVQTLLKDKMLYQGRIDGLCGPKTIKAIETFQSQFMRVPDSLINVNGTTWKKLTGQVPMGPPQPPQSTAQSTAQSTGAQKINAAGLQIIKESESCCLTAYPDPGTGGVPWTIGWGHTRGVVQGMRITQHQADVYLLQDLEEAESFVKRTVTVPLNSNQFSALVSLAYNVGSQLGSSTLWRKLNQGDYEGAAEEFPKWKFAGGSVLRGLVIRRDKERTLFMRPSS